MPTVIEKRVSLWNAYQLTRKSEDLLLWLEARTPEAPASSERLANELNRSKQVVGRTLKNLAQKGTQGLVENVSTHRGRFAWRLTQEGTEVVELIKGTRK